MQRCGSVKKRRPDRLKRLVLCESIFAPLEEHLRRTGLENREEAALLIGYITSDLMGVATSVLLPYTESTWAGCSLPLDVTVGCLDVVDRACQIVLAQVHTHPGRVCSHSLTDDDFAWSDSPGLLSIVVPCLGRFGVRRILAGGAAVHERLKTGQWHRLSPSEIRERLVVIPSFHMVL